MHSIPYKGGPDVVLTCGNTDGLNKTIETLSNEWGNHMDIRQQQSVVVEKFSYMGAIQTCSARGLQIVPIEMDSHGMLSSGPGGLEDVLSNWDESKGKRPHLMYTVSVGQNPTGGVLPADRKKQIYDLCRKYDIIIIEDEPYWFLQFDRQDTKEGFLKSLEQSYLNYDVEGRVVRLDTFSKNIAPGCRLGWITSQPAIIEKILRLTESSTQQPSGFVQSLVVKLVQDWGTKGWIDWLEGLCSVYEHRMRTMCGILQQGNTNVEDMDEEGDFQIVTTTPLYSVEWPQGGMFVWVKVNYSAHRLYGRFGLQGMASALWIWLTKRPSLVLAAPGAMFSSTESIIPQGLAYLRLCFAAVSEEEVRTLSERFVKSVHSFWDISDPKLIQTLIDEISKEQIRDLFLS